MTARKLPRNPKVRVLSVVEKFDPSPFIADALIRQWGGARKIFRGELVIERGTYNFKGACMDEMEAVKDVRAEAHRQYRARHRMNRYDYKK